MFKCLFRVCFVSSVERLFLCDKILFMFSKGGELCFFFKWGFEMKYLFGWFWYILGIRNGCLIIIILVLNLKDFYEFLLLDMDFMVIFFVNWNIDIFKCILCNVLIILLFNCV